MTNRVIMNGKVIAKTPRHGLICLGLPAILCFSAAAFGQSALPEAGTAKPAESAATLDHMPSQLPTVTFHNGELTIVAYNSSLHDILEMIRTQTGATMDIPSEATEHVFVNLGPGPTRKVLDSLLAGSSFNYILLGSETDPQALTKVVLSPKPTGNTEANTMAEAPTPGRRRIEAARARQQQAPPEDVEESAAPIQVASESPSNQEGATTAAAKPEDAAKTDGQEKTEAAADLGSQPAAGGQPSVDHPRTPNIKTAQEVLQDLYARRQAMQQQQQRQSSPQ